MNAYSDEFEDPSPGYLCRIAIGALALLPVAVILAATMQIMGPAVGAASLPAATADAVPFGYFPGGDDLQPVADEIPVVEHY